MKQFKLTFLLTMLISMVGSNTFAQVFDIDKIEYTFERTDSGAVAGVYSCKKTGNVVIPETITYSGKEYKVAFIHYNAFSGILEPISVSLPMSVTSIQYNSFYKCSGLTSITMPNVKSFGSGAFYGCTGLKSITIERSVEILEPGVFGGCSNLKTIYLNSNTIVSNKRKSGASLNNVFGSQITDYFLGEDVTEIGEYAFYGCENMKSITFSDNLQKIDNYAFGGCGGLKTLVLTNNITEIGNNAFKDCNNIESITLSNNLSKIGENAFINCNSLSGIEIPNSLATIGTSAFAGCEKLNKVIVRDLSAWCRIDFKDEKANPLTFAHHLYIDDNSEIIELNIPEGIGSIGKYAFYGASSIISCIIPKDIKDVSMSAFEGCTGLNKLSLGDGIVNIKERAFFGCSNLQVVEIPNSVTTIETSAFGETNIIALYIGTGVTSVASKAFGNMMPTKTIWFTNTPPRGYINAEGQVNYVSNEQYTSLTNRKVYPYLSSFFTVDGVKYVPTSPSERTCDIIDGCYDNTAEEINITSEVLYRNVSMTVKEMNSYSFYKNQLIKKVKLEFTGDIAYRAFEGCTSIEEVYIANNGNVMSNAFIGCKGLKDVTINNSGRIANSAFQDSGIQGTLKITNQGNISFWAFYNITGEFKAIIANKGNIGDEAFAKCTGLQEVIIGNEVTELKEQIFYGCTGLDSITIGSKVSKIGKEAFYDCKKLSKIVCYAITPPVCDINALDDINKWNCTLSIPKGSLSAYQQAPQWKEFFFIEEGTEADPVTITAKSYTREYGEDNPAFGYTSKGATLVGTPEITCEATAKSSVGTYPIVIKKGSVTNYNVTYVNGTLTITKAPLTVSVENVTREQYVENPEFVITYSGWKLNEDESVLTKKPTATTTATKDSPVGEYEIVVSGGKAQNYELSYQNGVLTVTESTGIATISVTNPANVYNVQGRMVRSKATTLKGLPSGVYIVNGQKVVVK